MGKNKTKFIIAGGVAGVIILGVVLFSAFYFIHLIASPWQGFRETNRDFQKNKELIFTVRDYLVGLEYNELHYSSQKYGMMFTGNDYINAEQTLEQLRKLGYENIDKQTNCVSFQRWGGLDVRKGIVYSIDGHIPDESSIMFLTKLEPLAEDGWYYYEADFNEWRVRNRDN